MEGENAMQPQDEQRLLTDHYDALIAENNDPVPDPPALAAYMERWDGAPFLELLALDGTQSVLEPGVGTGRLARRVAPLCRHFTGIDLSPATVARARTHLAAFGNTTLLCGDFMTCPLREAFDRVYASLFLFHFRDKAAVLARMASLLAPGGRLVLSVSRDGATELNMSGRHLPLYPDDPARTAALLRAAGLELTATVPVEAAYLLAADRPTVQKP